MKSALFTITLTVFVVLANAQSNKEFINEISVAESSLSAKQKSMVENVRKNMTYKKVQYVNMGDLANIQKGVILFLLSPEEREKLKLQPDTSKPIPRMIMNGMERQMAEQALLLFFQEKAK